MKITSGSMDIIDESSVVVIPLNKEWYQGRVSTIDMLRLDLIHPVISGNKWYKLKHNLLNALAAGYKTILTFGGAYSNHLVATAAAAKMYNLSSVGIVRGTYAEHELTATLRDCVSYGMNLVFVSREDYSKKTDPEYLGDLSKQFDRSFIIPEGGANEWGREGAEDIVRIVDESYTHICLSVGTGTTFIGVRNASAISTQVLGFVPMKRGTYLRDEMSVYVHAAKDQNWQLFDKWHFGGFGKWNKQLIAFMNDFYKVNQVPLDFVYEGKMMFGVKYLLDNDFFSDDSRILCIHSGGLQGNVSVKHLLDY